MAYDIGCIPGFLFKKEDSCKNVSIMVGWLKETNLFAQILLFRDFLHHPNNVVSWVMFYVALLKE